MQKDKIYLRELAKKQKEYANLPIMKEREKLWYKHNKLQGERPMVVMEEGSFLEDVLPPLKCSSEFDRKIELQLLQNIFVHEYIDDDKVIPDYFTVDVKIDTNLYGLNRNTTIPISGIGYHVDTVIFELEKDINHIKNTEINFDKQYTDNFKSYADDVLGDILPTKLKSSINHWYFCLTRNIVDLMGMEYMFICMMDEPEIFKKLVEFVKDDMINMLKWQKKNNLLFLNNENDYMGAGSFCFTNELPKSDDGEINTTDLWGHINSQESIGISPDMFHEFFFPSYVDIANQFGLVYYGCCEPVHEFWDKSIKNIPNLRKVSISAWCNEEYMAEQLTNSSVIYSRKPSPNFIGINKEFDDNEFSKYIKKTRELTKNCKSEYIFRDIYHLNGNLDKIKQAVTITKNIIMD